MALHDDAFETQRVTDRIRSLLQTLTPAEQKVARVVLDDPTGVIHLSVSQLAAAADSSLATVVRFCQSLGYRGYQDLKIRLARESAAGDEPLLEDIGTDDDVRGVARKVLMESASAFHAAVDNVDPAALEAVASALLDARRILFVAVGTSSPLAADAAYRLTTLGLDAAAPPDVHVQHVTARLLGKDDLCFVISHTGSTTETVAVARAARTAGARTAALTSFARSPLTEIVDDVVVAGSRETNYRVEAMTSRLVHLALLDALFVLVALRGGERCSDALTVTADVLTEHRY